MSQSSGGKKSRVPAPALPTFDPGPSIEAAEQVLRAVAAPHALIGGVALWSYVPTEEQRFTKDVDFAVPHAWMVRVEGEVRQRGWAVSPLTIGGLGVRSEGIRIDFIDRSVDFGEFFEAAVTEAQAGGRTVELAAHDVPIVSCEFLIAMKLASGEDDDERDIERLLRGANDLDLKHARQLAHDYLGAAAANRLDSIARRSGHPDARPRYKRAFLR